MSVDDALPAGILERYGITANTVHRPSHAMLSKLFILDDAWVLRGRPNVSNAVSEVTRETALMNSVKQFVSFDLPIPIPTQNGEPFILDADTLWTVHRFIPGHILGTWQKNHEIPEGDTERMFRDLAAMHAATKGKLWKPRESWYVKECRAMLRTIPGVLSRSDEKVVAAALTQVEAMYKAADEGDLAFVHGDFHHGNLLFQDGALAGVVDCNWCRIGHPYEDVAYTAMTYLRDYRDEHFTLHGEKLRQYLTWYGINPNDKTLKPYLLLSSAWDIATSGMFENPKDREFYQKYQKSVLQKFISTFF